MKNQGKKTKIHAENILIPGMTLINLLMVGSLTVKSLHLFLINLFKIVNVPKMEKIDANFIKVTWKVVAIQVSWLEIRCILET